MPKFTSPAGAAPTLPSPFVKPAGVDASTPVGGFTPDWAKLISSDPGLLQIEQTLGAGSVGDLASRNGAIQNAVTTFGAVPDMAKLAASLGMTQADLQNLLGPDVQKLAQENTDAGLSTEARLKQANADAIANIKASLNKRGILNSGEAGYQLDRQNTGYRQAESDATQKLLDYLGQYQQGYASAQAQRAQGLASAYSSAADRQYNTNQGSAGVTATFDHVDPSGAAVYKGPDGSLYNSDGSPYAAPQAPTPPPPAPTLPTYSSSGGGRGVVNV